MSKLTYEDKPNKKWYTDVIEFNLRGEKCYLSPILYDMSNKEFDNKNLEGLIFY